MLLAIVALMLYCKGGKNQSTEKENIDQEYLYLESTYSEMLQPIVRYKESHPNLYWFVVSWLGTQYKTPRWEGYGNEGWRENTKQRGIDCSGFARVMQDQIFNKEVRGGSQGILDQYCNRISKGNAELGDLVFFRAPGSRNDRIVHVGVYLHDGFFVHATSSKSASQGQGLMINSLNENNWSEEFVTAGKIK